MAASIVSATWIRESTSLGVSGTAQAGDIAIYYGLRNSSASPPNLPTGFTNITTTFQFVDSYTYARLAYKVMSGGETSIAGLTMDTYSLHQVALIRGGDISGYLYNVGQGRSTSQAVTGVSPTQSGMLVGLWGQYTSSGAGGYTPPSGMSEIADTQGGSFIPHGAMASQSVGAGATGTKTATANQSGDYVGYLFYVKHLNTGPSAPTLNVPTATVHGNVTYNWTFNDADAGDTQSAYYLRIKRRP